jgi:hypothetical protein
MLISARGRTSGLPASIHQIPVLTEHGGGQRRGVQSACESRLLGCSLRAPHCATSAASSPSASRRSVVARSNLERVPLMQARKLDVHRAINSVLNTHARGHCPVRGWAPRPTVLRKLEIRSARHRQLRAHLGRCPSLGPLVSRGQCHCGFRANASRCGPGQGLPDKRRMKSSQNAVTGGLEIDTAMELQCSPAVHGLDPLHTGASTPV